MNNLWKTNPQEHERLQDSLYDSMERAETVPLSERWRRVLSPLPTKAELSAAAKRTEEEPEDLTGVPYMPNQTNLEFRE